MAIVVGASASSNTSTVNRPAGVDDGNVLVAFCYAADSLRIAAPVGWVEVKWLDTGSYAIQLAYKIVTDATSEPVSYTWTAGTVQGLGITALSEVDTASPLASDVSDSQATLLSDREGVTTDTEDTLLVMGVISSSGAVSSTTMTQQWSRSRTYQATFFTEAIAASGETGARRFSVNLFGGLGVAFRPSSGDAPPAAITTGRSFVIGD